MAQWWVGRAGEKRWGRGESFPSPSFRFLVPFPLLLPQSFFRSQSKGTLHELAEYSLKNPYTSTLERYQPLFPLPPLSVEIQYLTVLLPSRRPLGGGREGDGKHHYPLGNRRRAKKPFGQSAKRRKSSQSTFPSHKPTAVFFASLLPLPGEREDGGNHRLSSPLPFLPPSPPPLFPTLRRRRGIFANLALSPFLPPLLRGWLGEEGGSARSRNCVERAERRERKERDTRRREKLLHN